MKNIFIVVIDALRADKVGCVSPGNPSESLTPNIDEIAEQATVFQNAFSTTNATDPAMTSLLSGRYPTSTVVNHGQYITDEELARIEATPLLQKELQRAGMRTVQTGRGLGRWHRRGYDVSIAPDKREHSTSFSSVTKELREDIERMVGRTLHTISPTLTDKIRQKYQSVTHNEATRSAIDDHLHLLDESNDETPSDSSGGVFGLLHLMDTHAGYEPRDELIERYRDRHPTTRADGDIPLAELADRFDGTATPTGERFRHWSRKYSTYENEVGLGHVAARYDGAVREADERVGRFVDGLKERGIWDESALIVLSDHGESLEEHGIYHDHHGLYDVSTHIPLIVRLPGEQADRSDELVSILDIAPTIVDLLGLDDVSMVFDGKSLRPLLSNSGTWNPRSGVLAEERHTQTRRMVRTKRYKLIEVPDPDRNGTVCRYCDREHAPAVELYDLDADPDETENLADDMPDTVEQLRDAYRTETEGFEPPPDPVEGDVEFEDEETVLEQLEALGYR